MTLFLEKRALFCQILQAAASDYQILIYFGLLLNRQFSTIQPNYILNFVGFHNLVACYFGNWPKKTTQKSHCRNLETAIARECTIITRVWVIVFFAGSNCL